MNPGRPGEKAAVGHWWHDPATFTACADGSCLTLPACDCCDAVMVPGQSHQHPTEDAVVCDECFASLRRMTEGGCSTPPSGSSVPPSDPDPSAPLT